MMKRLISIFFAATACVMLAQDSFLNMGANIPGDSQTKGYEKQVQVFGFSYEGSTLQKVSGLNVMVFSKRFDVASPKILEAVVRGTHLPDVTLTLTRPSETTPKVYGRVVMKDVVVTGIKIGGSDEVASEDITLQYDRAEWCQISQSSNGGASTETCVSIAPR